VATKQRLIEVLTTAMEKPDIANALIQRVINELKKEWVGLTDDEMLKIWNDPSDYKTLFKRAELILKEKNFEASDL
jgi:hypothetical protein